ncbi:MAG: hypothetical protein L3J04_11575, partial [Robiginitomaculum sp.]|nr:hypothetical protein [Robiginitomaculum sp.]
MNNKKTKPTPVSAHWQRMLCWVLTSCLISQSVLAIPAQSPEKQQAQFIDYLKEEQDRYRTLFDQEELLDVLDYDTDKIIEFVSNKIVYQAYDGVLRGAKGTLIGRAGNSHDQAITLAGMLNDAGLEAEILVGKLTVEQAKELNLTIAMPQLSELQNTLESSESAIAKKMFSQAQRLVKENGESLSVLMAETDALAQRILKQLPAEQLKKGRQVFQNNVDNSARAYRWVRYRLAQGEEWTEIHPAYAGANKWNLIPGSFEKNSVNSKDLQQLSVEIWIENSAGEKHSITGQWKKPTANLLNHTLSIEIGSDAMMKPELLRDTEEMFKQSHFFFVQVDGELPEKGKVFDLRGNIYSADSLSGLNSIFSTLNKKTQKAADALGGLSFNKESEQKSDTKQLTKVWLEFTIEKPNGQRRQIERVIFDGKAMQDRDKTAMRLLQRWDIDVATTTPMQQFYQHEKSQKMISAIEGLQKFQSYFENKPNAEDQEVMDKYVKAMGNPTAALLTHKRSIFDRFEFQDDIVSYLNEPNILAVRRGFNHSDAGFSLYEMTDIVANQRWSFERNNAATLSPSLVAGIKHGVWETRTEGARTLEQQNTIYSGSAFEQLDQPNAYREHLSDQAMNLFDESNTAWWSVDLQTGSAVGMMELAQGAAGSEILEHLAITHMVITFVFAIVGSIACVEQAGASLVCCMVANALVAGVGYGLSYAITLAFAKSIVVIAFASPAV